MADRISLSEEEKNSLEQLDVFLEVHKDLMDFTGTSDSDSTPLAGASKTVVTESTMEKNSSTFDGGSTLQPAPLEAPPATIRKRKRFAFSKKRLLANSDLFSIDKCPVPGISGKLVGEIIQCPSKKNNGRFFIDWSSASGMPSSIPRSKLQNWFLSDDVLRTKLQHGVREYEQAVQSGDLNHILRNTFGGSLEVVGSPEPANTTINQTPPPATIDTPARYSARADLTTMSDTASSVTMSQPLTQDSLINSTTIPTEMDATDSVLQMAPPPPTKLFATRNRAIQEGVSDIDSGSEEDDDVDEDDDAWSSFHRTEEDDLSDQDRDADDDISSISTPSSVNKSLKELVDSLTFKFEAIDPELRTLKPKQRINNRLRRQD